MKSIKQIFFILFIGLTATVFCQPSGETSTNIYVSLIKGLSFATVDGELDFGEHVIAGNSSTLQKTPGNGLTLLVSGQPAHDVVFDFNSTQLSNSNWIKENGGEEGTLLFNPAVEHTFSNPQYSDSQPVLNGNAYQLVNEDGIGNLYVWVGGEINVNEHQPAGDYNGTFTITVSY